MGKADNRKPKSQALKDGYKTVKKNSKGGVQVVQAKNGNQTFCMVEYVTNTEKSAEKAVKNIQGQMELAEHGHWNHNQQLVDYEVKKDSGFCSTTWVIRSFYNCVKDDLHNRPETYNGCQDHETLTNALYGGLHGLDEWTQVKKDGHSVAYGDVRPENVAFDHGNRGVLRVKDQTWGKNMWEIAVNRVAKDRKEGLYLSPELYTAIIKKGKKESVNEHKNDVFALGMSVLNAGTKSNTAGCYAKDGFNSHVLESLIHEFHQIHGASNTLMCDMVDLCLTVDAHHRHTAHELLQKVPAYTDIVAHYVGQRVVDHVDVVVPEQVVHESVDVIRDGHVVKHEEFDVVKPAHVEHVDVVREVPSRVVVDGHHHHGSRVISQAPVHTTSHVTHPATFTHSTPVTTHVAPVTTHHQSHVVSSEPKVIRGDVVRNETRVVRENAPEVSTVVERRDPIVRYEDAPKVVTEVPLAHHTTSHVVRTEGTTAHIPTTHSTGTVVRRSVVGGTHTTGSHVVREGGSRVIREGETYTTGAHVVGGTTHLGTTHGTTGTVIRRSVVGDAHHTTGTVVREGGSRVIRDGHVVSGSHVVGSHVVGGTHSTGTVVRRSVAGGHVTGGHVVGSHVVSGGHVTGGHVVGSHVVSGHHQTGERRSSRKITDPAEIEKYKAGMTSGFAHNQTKVTATNAEQDLAQVVSDLNSGALEGENHA